MSATFPIFKDDRIETLLDNECGDNHLLKEQYYDYILNRQFRTSIVTHLENREKCNISRHIQINDLKNIYIRTNLNAESASKVVQSLKAHYPNTMKVSDFVERYFTDNRNDGYTSVLLEIYNENIDFYARNIAVTKQDKIKLKTVYRKYLDYYFNTEKPVISLSNFVGNTLVLNSGDIHAILYGHRMSRDLVRTQLRWLEEQGLVKLENCGYLFIAKLTARGFDVSQNQAVAEGVKKNPFIDGFR